MLRTKVVAEEELLKADSKGDNQEAELLILDEFAVLCRDLYAFYPMLIRYVDNNRYNISREDQSSLQDFQGDFYFKHPHGFPVEFYPPICLVCECLVLWFPAQM